MNLRLNLSLLATLFWLSGCAPQTIEPRAPDTPTLIPSATPETEHTITLALNPAPKSCWGPEITRAVLALQKTKGYISFALPPPSVEANGVPHFGTMTVTFDPAQIAPDALTKIIADASGLTVMRVKWLERKGSTMEWLLLVAVIAGVVCCLAPLFLIGFMGRKED